jgi:hypothetical protein
MSKTCRLRLFTWMSPEPDKGRREVSPICPDHSGSRVLSGTFGDGIVVICEVGNHLLNHCEPAEFEAEKQEARIILQSIRA